MMLLLPRASDMEVRPHHPEPAGMFAPPKNRLGSNGECVSIQAKRLLLEHRGPEHDSLLCAPQPHGRCAHRTYDCRSLHRDPPSSVHMSVGVG